MFYGLAGSLSPMERHRPRISGHQGRAERAGWAKARALHMAGRLDGVRILIVDDERDVQEAMNFALQAEGAETMAVSDGNAAILAVQDGMPDIVVLDMMLPKRSGFLVLEKIKGYEDCPIVIMVTANEGHRHQAYAQSLGVDDYLLKPVPMQRLVDKAVELLKKRDEEDEAIVGGESEDSPER